MKLEGKCKNEMQKYFENFCKSVSSYSAINLKSDLIKDIKINVSYGSISLCHISNIVSENMKSLKILPYDKTDIKNIVYSLEKENLGISISSDSEGIYLIMTPPSEEKRKEIIKRIKKDCEDCKIGIRLIRKNYNTKIDKSNISQNAKKEVQKYTDEYILKIDELYKNKSKFIMET